TNSAELSDEYGLPSSQLPVECDPPHVSREIQAKSALEIDCGRLQLLPVDLGASFLECKHDQISVRSNLQCHDVISKHRAYLSNVCGAAIQIAAHIGHEHTTTEKAAVGLLIELDRIQLRGDALAITGVRQDHVLGQTELCYVVGCVRTYHAIAFIVRRYA